MTGVDDLSWADAHLGQEPGLGDIFCLTFIRGVDGPEALRRMGGLPDTAAVRTLSDLHELHDFDTGYPTAASALPLGTWTVVVEPNGFEGSHRLDGLSHGTEAVSVLRHDYASDSFGYAVDGELVSGFDPVVPAYRHGSDPDLLLPHLLDAGFGAAHEDDVDDPIARCPRIAELITGVLPSFEALTGPLLSAHVEPWFGDARRPPAGRPGHDGPVDAVAEVRRLTTLHDLTGTPGLADALAAASRGERVEVSPESPLGLHVRAWGTESRRASWSLNDHRARHRMTEADVRRAHDLGWLAQALGDALQPPRD
ncbi:DUF6461 domain-containing protein [Saccharothrix sp. Mg75]|uniref:DUF6461 domain-containing protein n=1 Tax=Saccharothrix sp. Mg75 TaxID=3445357 RepID=UPI003EEB4163